MRKNMKKLTVATVIGAMTVTALATSRRTGERQNSDSCNLG